MKKAAPYLLIAAVLVLGIVFFVQSQNAQDDGLMLSEDEMSEDASGTRLAGEEIVFADGVYQIDTEATEVLWHGEKTLVDSDHMGMVQVESGQVEFMDGMITSGAVVVDMTSIELTPGDTGGEQLVGHLKSEDFFAVEEYPTAELSIADVSGSVGEQQITADLTIKGTTEPVTFTMMPSFGPADRPVLVGTLMFDRSMYDVRFGSPSFFNDLGDGVISDDISLTITLVLGQEAPSTDE